MGALPAQGRVGLELTDRGRLKYPKFDRPVLGIEGGAGEVLNLSVTGLKFRGPKGLVLNYKDSYVIEIHFVEQKPFTIVARMTRKVGDLYSLAFKKPIPKSILDKEVTLLKKRNGKVEIS